MASNCSERESISDFSARLVSYISEHKSTKLIIDLRHNNGGDTYTQLLKNIIAFSNNSNHQLYVIIGRNTFSAAINFAVDLERLTNAIFVGEPFSGKPNSFGDAALFTLPYSGLRIELASVTWQLSSPRDSRSWISPQLPVILRATDYFSGKDPCMDAIRALIQSQRK